MFKPILVPHGITDIIDTPQSIVVYGTVIPIVYALPVTMKRGLLIAGSLYHLRNDVPGGLLGNILMHWIWIHNPVFAELYLTWIHTPRHYQRNLSFRTGPKLIAIGIMTIITVLEGRFHWTQPWKPLWWVGPILSHIVTEILNHDCKVYNHDYVK